MSSKQLLPSTKRKCDAKEEEEKEKGLREFGNCAGQLQHDSRKAEPSSAKEKEDVCPVAATVISIVPNVKITKATLGTARSQDLSDSNEFDGVLNGYPALAHHFHAKRERIAAMQRKALQQVGELKEKGSVSTEEEELFIKTARERFSSSERQLHVLYICKAYRVTELARRKMKTQKPTDEISVEQLIQNTRNTRDIAPASVETAPPSTSNSHENIPRAGNFRSVNVDVLREWLLAHLMHPYPTQEQKMLLAAQANLSFEQVTTWFSNIRCRVWAKLIRDMPNSNPASIQKAIHDMRRYLYGERTAPQTAVPLSSSTESLAKSATSQSMRTLPQLLLPSKSPTFKELDG
ncbi:MAG: hypothetical protein MHM6MM_000243 [Cercozoa sp. M6MM]